MRLLILTQKVDVSDPILGFFHGWIEEFAKHCEKVTVICLQEGLPCEMRSNFSERKIISQGDYNLPKNVKVFSLGKEKGVSTIKYIFNFYKYIWRERKNYDSVFVHMNPEYIVLGGLFWRLWNKKIALWYNHQQKHLIATIAGLLANKIFYTSPFSYFAKQKKAEKMPAGIDTTFFKRDNKINKIKNSILYLGRISPIKNIDILVQAVIILDKKNVDFVLNIVGSSGEKDERYYEEIKKIAETLEFAGKIKFFNEIPNYKTLEIYNQNEIFVNLTNSGSFDKTVVEAMACETLAVFSNQSFAELLPDKWPNFFIFKENDANDLARVLLSALKLTDQEKVSLGQKLNKNTNQKHSLVELIKMISIYLKE